MSDLPPEDIAAIRSAARALKKKMDEVYGEDFASYQEKHTPLIISTLFERAKEKYLAEEGPVPPEELEVLLSVFRRVVAEVVAEEFGVVVDL